MRPDEITRKILEIRGIVSEDDIREFLSPKPQLSHDPFLLPEMEAGVAFLLDKLKTDKRICIYGDYDVDGICGTAIMTLFFRDAARIIRSEAEITYYIPDRIEEGYGLNNTALKDIRDSGADTVVTVDCGSISAREVAYAKEIGLDILITDHHDPDPDSLPECIHINPKLKMPEGGYPFGGLSGAGVAFKLCGALQRHLGEEKALLNKFVDLACVATIADVVPLVNENRTIVKYGLSMLRSGKRPALRELLAVSGTDPAGLDVRDVAYRIAPRLNAIGRLSDGAKGVELFLSEDEARIRELAEDMNSLNTERQLIQEKCFQECMALFDSLDVEDGKPVEKFLLLKPTSSHEGVAGIVAGKVREATGFPCAVLTASAGEDGEFLKGSARSGGRLDITALLRRHSGLFERLGGHAAAAGFLIRADNEALLREALARDLEAMLGADETLLDSREEAELEIELSDVSLELAEALRQLAPFGKGNPAPTLSLDVEAKEIGGVRRIGQNSAHLKFLAGGIGFIFFDGAATVFPKEGKIRVFGCPQINEWNGRREIQFAVSRIDLV